MSQTKYKWMVFLVLILLISNMILAFFLFFASDKQEKKRDNSEEWAMKIYKEIGLDTIQIKAFKKEKDEYFSMMRPIWNENKKAKDSLYRNLSANISDSSITQYLEQINRTNHFSDSFTFAHFIKLRAMCTPNQQVRFDTIIPKLINRPRGRR
jgi:hypothetical protein